MEEIKTIKEKTIELIDALKATCQTYGMGNDGNEYKIITQVFLYKFLNDKFGYEVKKVSPVLKNAEKWELAYAEMSEDDRLDIFDSLPSDIPLLNPEHLIANLWNQQAKGIIGDKDYRIINVRNISSSSILLDENELDIISLPHKKGDKYCVTDDSIIIARSGIPGATRILFKPTTNTIFCGFIICCTPTDKELQYYLTFYLKLLEGSSATQTGGSILQNVSQDTLSSLPVPIPPKMLLDEFNQTVLQTFELIHTNMNETSQLINLRDWLLPMLMNGQATIND